jgi:hypothetical protein
MDEKQRTRLRQLFSQATETQLQECALELRRYLDFIVRLHESIHSDPKRSAAFKEEVRKIQIL